MPTVEVKRGRSVSPAAPGAISVSPGAFTAESRALARFGEAVQDFGGTVAGAIERAQFVQESLDLQRATDGYQKMLDEDALARSTNKDYETWPSEFQKRHAAFQEQTMPTLSKSAQKTFQPYLDRQKSAQGTRIQVDAVRRGAMQWNAGLPREIDQNVDTWTEDAELGDREWAVKKDRWRKAGFFMKEGPGSEEDIDRIRVMMKGQTYSQRFPGAAVEFMADTDAMTDSGLFTEADVELLASTDIEALQKDAQQNLEFQKDQTDAAHVRRVSEVQAGVTALAAKGDFAGAQTKLNDNIEIIGLEKHKSLSNTLKDTSKFFGETSINYYEQTHRPSVEADMRSRVVAGEVTDSAIVWQSTGINGYSDEAAGRIVKMISDKPTGRDFNDTVGATTFNDMFDNFIKARREGISQLAEGKRHEERDAINAIETFGKETGHRWLKQWQIDHPHATLREQQEEAMRIQTRVEQTLRAGDLATTPEELPSAGQPREPGDKVKTGGETIGTVDDDGKIVLNEKGLRRLLRITGGNVVRAREIIADRGWKEPD